MGDEWERQGVAGVGDATDMFWIDELRRWPASERWLPLRLRLWPWL